MKKLLLTLICLAALCLSAASAEPMASHAGYTAYLGESNYLYLRDPMGVTKVLRYPISDVLSVTDTHVYAISHEGQLFGIRLDGTQTLILAAAPTEEDVAKVTPAARFELNGTVLYALRPNGGKLLISSSVTAAAATDDRLFFIETHADGATSIRAILLDGVTDTTMLAPIPTTLGQGVASPLSMTVTEDALTIVDSDHSVRVTSLVDNTQTFHKAVSENTVKAICLGTTVLRYAQTEDGQWLYESDAALPTLVLAEATEKAAPADVPHITPTATLRPTATPSPTPSPTKKATATPKPEEEYPELKYGDKGSAVRSMQKRLKALGYPVGTVDGTWGKNTQLAVNLFQNAAGLRERSYATSSMQEKLYSRKAPAYDPYAPLNEGDEGTPVKLLQKALFDLGYLGTDEKEEVDGRYGPITTAAVKAFQAAVGGDVLKITGKADADTLMVLFSDNPPRNPALDAPVVPDDPQYPEFIVPDNPNYPEFIVPDVPVLPPDVSTGTDLVVIFTPDQT